MGEGGGGVLRACRKGDFFYILLRETLKNRICIFTMRSYQNLVPFIATEHTGLYTHILTQTEQSNVCQNVSSNTRLQNSKVLPETAASPSDLSCLLRNVLGPRSTVQGDLLYLHPAAVLSSVRLQQCVCRCSASLQFGSFWFGDFSEKSAASLFLALVGSSSGRSVKPKLLLVQPA